MATNEPLEQPDQFESAQPPPPQTSPSSGGLLGIPTKWLLIGGGGGGGVLVIVIVVVAILLLTGGGGGASGGSDVLGYVPADSEGIVIADNAAYLSGDVPEDLVDYLEEEDNDGSFGISSESYDLLDIDDDDVELYAGTINRNFDPALEIVQGEFDFDVIREELEDGLDCEDDDYRGFEIWECPDAEFPAVALFEKDGYVVFAVERQDDLEDVLTYKAREPENLADDSSSDINQILGQLDGGWLQMGFLIEECPINRCQGFAISLGKSDDSESIPASYAVRFSSERVATGNVDNIEIDDLIQGLFAEMQLDLDIEDVQADGEFVVGEGTAEFVDPGSSSEIGDGQSSPSATAAPARRRSTPVPPAPAQPASTAAAARPTLIVTPTLAPTVTPTAVPLREPASVFNLIPEDSRDILLVRWDQTESGGYLPSTRERQVFDTIDLAKNAYDVSPDNISEIAFVDDRRLTILRGEFDKARVRTMLEEQNGQQTNYRGYELWQSNRGQVILFDQYIAFGNGVENILQALYRGSGSLADASENNDMLRIISRLSEGSTVWVERNCSFDNCLGYGWSIASIDETADTASMVIEFLFRNERSAQSAADDYDGIAKFLSRQRINIHDTVADANFVVGTAVWDFAQ